VDQLVFRRDGGWGAAVGGQTLRRVAEEPLNRVDGAPVSSRVHRRAGGVR
jgi:hypothetical protein